MKSEECERWLAWKKAEEDDDIDLKNFYKCYYAGMLNAKELKKALEVHGSANTYLGNF